MIVKGGRIRLMAVIRQVPKSVDFTQAASLIRSAQRISVICHINPDADAIGSAAALALALSTLGKDIYPTFGENRPVPRLLQGIPGAELFVPMAELPHDVDLIITVDCSTIERTGELLPVAEAASDLLVIDHHATNSFFGTANLIDPQAESTTAILLTLFDELDIDLNAAIAEALYSGLMMDTGSFRWGGAEGHRIAARLLDYGFSASAVARRIMDSHPLSWLSLLGTVLSSTVVLSEEGHPSMIIATAGYDDIQQARREDVEGIIDIVRAIEDIPLALVLKEYTRHVWSVSLRSVPPFDVATIAVRLGGGGHRQAAGFNFNGTRDELIELLRKEIQQSL